MNTTATGEIIAERPSRAATIPWYKRHGIALIVALVVGLAFFISHPANDARGRAYAAMNRPGVTLTTVGGKLDAAKFQLAPGVEKEKGNLGWAFHQLRRFPEVKQLETDFLLDVNLAVFNDVTNLESLSIGEAADLTDDHFAFLQRLTKLEKLAVNGMRITPQMLKHVEGSPKLKSLKLSTPRMADGGFESVAGIPNLEALTIEGGRGEWKQPLSLGRPAKLKSLRLANLSAKPEQLLGALDVEALEELSLWNVNVDRAFFRRLRELPRLRVLKIRSSERELLDEVMSEIAAIKTLESLFVADHTGGEGPRLLSARGMKTLATAKSLKELAIWGAPIGDEGVAAISGLPLQSLVLSQVGATERSFATFLKMRTLKTLSLYEPSWSGRRGIDQTAIMRLGDEMMQHNKTIVEYGRGIPWLW